MDVLGFKPDFLFNRKHTEGLGKNSISHQTWHHMRTCKILQNKITYSSGKEFWPVKPYEGESIGDTGWIANYYGWIRLEEGKLQNL